MAKIEYYEAIFAVIRFRKKGGSDLREVDCVGGGCEMLGKGCTGFGVKGIATEAMINLDLIKGRIPVCGFQVDEGLRLKNSIAASDKQSKANPR